MTKDSETLIEQYLERVRVYLPLDSEDVIAEIRTHILMAAQEIGEGIITPGSTLMAIERLGDPKAVANEYAGTGEKKGPVPAEYVQPLARILVALIAIGAAFIGGAYVVGIAYADALGSIWTIENFPFIIPLMIVVNVFFVIFIIGGISLITDRDKLMTERTTLEGVFGIGSGAFKPKSKLEAVGDVFFSIFFAIVILIPAVQLSFKPGILVFMDVVALLLLIGAVKGLLYYLAGENNLNLLFEALLSVGWVILALFLINFAFPIDYIVAFSNGQWTVYSIAEIAALVPSFDLTAPIRFGWIVFIFILVVTNIWKVLVSGMKIPMYLKQGKKLWWKGTWGTRKYHKLRRRFWEREPELPSSEERTYEDGYQNQD